MLESNDRNRVGWLNQSRRCSRDTYPESYSTEYILMYEDKEEDEAKGGRPGATLPGRGRTSSSDHKFDHSNLTMPIVWRGKGRRPGAILPGRVECREHLRSGTSEGFTYNKTLGPYRRPVLRVPGGS